MSNPIRLHDPLVDESPEKYLLAKGIYDRCVMRLREMDKNDAVRPLVVELMKLARAEMEKQASFLPY
jgi:hypothetical protein